jgi:hypothetical protein
MPFVIYELTTFLEMKQKPNPLKASGTPPLLSQLDI